jgi:NTE family protein
MTKVKGSDPSRPPSSPAPSVEARGLTHSPPHSTPRIALALGGGGARGLAHLLMLEALDEMGIKPTLIVGTSIGAIFGAAYASGLSARLIRAHTEEVLRQRLGFAQYLLAARAEPVLKLLNILPVRTSLLSPTLLLDQVLPSRIATDFASLAIPFKAVATDFYAQEQVVMDTGDLRSAIAASIALPALFSGVQRDNRLLMDGGLVNPLPFDLLEGAADITVAIDVTGASSGPGKRLQPSALAALVSSSQILQRSIVREKLRASQPDVYIDVDVDKFHVLEFHRFKEVLAAAQPAKEQLQRQLQRVLASQTVETLMLGSPEGPPDGPDTPPPRRLRVIGLRRLARRRRPA